MDKKIPEIRFKEFEGEWQPHQLNHYLVVSSEKNESGEYDKYDIYSVSREYGVINQIEYQGKSFAGASLTNYGVVMKGDVVYTKSPLKSQPYGIIKTNEGKIGIVSALYGVFHPTDEVNSTFVQTYFELDSRINDYLRPLVNKGAKNTLLISDVDSLKGEVIFPKKEEQNKLVSLFNTLDKLICKLEQKLEKLRNIKQALLNQMFINVNGGGYETPLLRFARYNKPWVMSKLESYFVERTERSAIGELLSVTMADGIVKAKELDRTDNSSEDKSNYKVVHRDDIAYNSMRMWQGASGYSNYDGIVSPAYTVVTPKNEDVDVVFIHYLFKRNDMLFQFRINSQGLTSDTWNLRFSHFSQIRCHIPSKSEQETIAVMFKYLENYIANCKTKLAKLRNTKQSLLHKMFV